MNNSAAEMAAEQAVRAQLASRGGRVRSVLGVDPARYAKYKTPGIDQTRMISDPVCMLKDPERRYASGEQYIWRNPDDPITKAMCLRKVLTPVLTDEIDPNSPYANVYRAKIITKEGPREVVRTPAGLGLFKAPPSAQLSNLDQGLLPGEQWEAKYLEEFQDRRSEFGSDLDGLSDSSSQGRVRPNNAETHRMGGEGIVEIDTRRESPV